METLEQLKGKRKKALIAIFTLGISALPKAFWEVDTNIFKGTSLNNGALGFLLRIFSFLLLTTPFMAVMVVINIFKAIYYQIEIRNY
jgi:hypothetical protein